MDFDSIQNLDLFLSFILGILSSAAVGYFYFRLQKKTDDILVSSAELQKSASNMIKETQELHSLRTALVRNQQDRQTEMLKMGEQLSHHVKEQVEDLILGMKHPDFFSSNAVMDLTPRETKHYSDTPRVGHFLIDKEKVVPGDEINILFRVNDDKWNFSVPSGVKITHSGGLLSHEKTTAKYMYANLKISENFANNLYELKMNLTDDIGNENEQFISIPISEKQLVNN